MPAVAKLAVELSACATGAHDGPYPWDPAVERLLWRCVGVAAAAPAPAEPLASLRPALVAIAKVFLAVPGVHSMGVPGWSLGGQRGLRGAQHRQRRRCLGLFLAALGQHAAELLVAAASDSDGGDNDAAAADDSQADDSAVAERVRGLAADAPPAVTMLVSFGGCASFWGRGLFRFGHRANPMRLWGAAGTMSVASARGFALGLPFDHGNARLATAAAAIVTLVAPGTF